MMSARRPLDLAIVAVVAVSLVLLATAAAGCGGTQAPSTSAVSQATSAGGTTGTTGTTGATGGASTSTSQPAGAVSADWPTYHHDASRSGVSSDQAALGSVKQAWASVALDGAVYAQPLAVGGRVFVATESNTVYALDASTGKTAWQRNLGQPVAGGDLPCGNIDPSGITGTPVVDASGGVLYVVANLKSGPHHDLFALALADGSVRWHRTVDPPALQAAVEQQRGALALSGGKVYVPFGGLYGDCGPYKGAVVSTAADGTGDLSSYAVPTRREAGIWNPAGPAVDASGDLWVTTGNSAGQSAFDFGNAVIRLDAALKVLDYFAPGDWAQLNAGDADLGSLGPALLPNGRVFAMGKDGVAYLLDAGNLGQVGHPLTSLKTGAAAFGAAAVLGSTVFVPTTEALLALSAGGDTLSQAWKVGGGSCPPIVAGGAVWAVGYDGKLRAVDPASGTVLFSADLGSPVSRFVSPAAADGMVFVPAGRSVTAFSMR